MNSRRRVIKGTPISSGIVLGRAQVVLPGVLNVPEVTITAAQVKREQNALRKAVDRTVSELRDLRASAVNNMSSSVSKVFDAQLLIADDQEFLARVFEEIATRRRNAAFVYNLLVRETSLQLQQSQDDYLRQMAHEIETVAHQVLLRLGGKRKGPAVRFKRDTILVGKSFSPGDIVEYRKRKAIGFVASEGGTNSHAALIARSLLSPMTVIGADWTLIGNDDQIVLDGTSGDVIVHPSEEEWAEYQRLKKRQGPAILSRIKKLPEIPPLTADGEAIHIMANLEFPGSVEDILAERKIPVGLYRTEFLYIGTDRFPDEETQTEHYQRIATQFAGTSVILRTFDLGSDKVHEGVSPMHEANPALGFRGIRSMLEMPEVFKTQVRAILRASTGRNLRILLPMISDISEIQRAKRLISQAKLELRRDGVAFDERIPVGIMVEVPSAALMAEQLARQADFISIGTNDLTQYTMAADRGNALVADLYSAFHPAVLNLVKNTVDACEAVHTPVCICGEIAGDLLALPLFIGMGVRELSLNPSRIFDTCRTIPKIDSGLVRHIMPAVLSSSSAASAIRKLKSFRDEIGK